MKEEFSKKLEDGEELIIYGVLNVNRTNKQYGRFAIGFVVLLSLWVFAISNIKVKNFSSFSIFITLIILTMSLIYGLIYNIFSKYRRSNEYFITSKRIALYDQKKGFRLENISDIEHLGIVRERDNYGDLIFGFSANNLLHQLRHGMSFKGVDNPRKIVSILSNINENIHVYDDRPTSKFLK